MITFEDIKNNPTISTYIQRGNEVLGAVGYTEHGFAHAAIVSDKAAEILTQLGHDSRTVELARIAGWMHDVGNCINRHDHAHTGAMMAFVLLERAGMDAGEISQVIGAIGHHDEGTASVISPVSAALILADKCDVRRSRVRSKNTVNTDIHDRVNFAVHAASLTALPAEKRITLSLTIDTAISAVMDYFEIFLTRMLLCRKAAEYLGLRFQLEINDTQLL